MQCDAVIATAFGLGGHVVVTGRGGGGIMCDKRCLRLARPFVQPQLYRHGDMDLGSYLIGKWDACRPFLPAHIPSRELTPSHYDEDVGPSVSMGACATVGDYHPLPH